MRRSVQILIVASILFTPAWVRAQQQEEYAALMAILKDPTLDARVKAGEEFVLKYPKSEYLPNVRQKLVYDYNEKNNAAKVIEHGELLELKDGVALTFLANAYSGRKNDAKTVETAQKAIQVLNTEKNEGVTEKQKNTLLHHDHYLMGNAYANMGRRKSGAEKSDLLAKARLEMIAATKLNPRDDAAYFELGMILSDMGEGPDAIDALAKAVVINGSKKIMAESELERVYVHYNKSRLGLDKVLAKARGTAK